MKNNTIQRTTLSIVMLGALFAPPVLAETEQETIKALIERIEVLEKALEERSIGQSSNTENLYRELNEKVEILADTLESSESSAMQAKGRVHIGGYGELHYNNLDEDGKDVRQLDFHRAVLFFGYDFNDRARFVSEVEIEHIIASGGSRGAVELEQVYVEIDLKRNLHLQTGVLLMPVGIINETHEPPTFYGVERPIVEQTIIPTTWWSAGVGLTHNLDNGIRYDVMLTEGLKTEDPNSNLAAEPFNIKRGKQKGSFADAFDLAVTGRIKYTGLPGLELAVYAQYQPDLDQSAEQSYADSATLFGGHVIYQLGDFMTKALYARWDLAGDDAEAAEMDVQDGAYIELAWRPSGHWGAFTRYSTWSQAANEDSTQIDFGFNYYPFKDIVFKAAYQIQNDDAGNADGFNLGFGYQF